MVRRTENTLLGFPGNVFVLSLVSFFNDIGGETIKRAIPLYLANTLGVSKTIIGLVEGIADATPQLLQVPAGYISDQFQKRKPIILVGQAMRTSMVFLFWVTTWPQVLILRFLDRSGKGLNGSPRDALVSASSEPGRVGKSFGLNRAMDNAGAVVGLLLAASIVGAVAGGVIMTRALFHKIILLAVIPLTISFILLMTAVRDIPIVKKSSQVRFHDRLGTKFYVFLFFSFLFALGNSSDAFLVLKTQAAGVPLAVIFLVLAGYSLVASVSGYLLSSLSDRVGRKRLIVIGGFVYALIYFFFARVNSSSLLIGLFLLYGLYYGFTEGSGKAFISDIVAEHRKGMAYGIYNAVFGFTLLPASLLGGFLWQTVGPSATFYFGATMAAIGSTGLLFFL